MIGAITARLICLCLQLVRQCAHFGGEFPAQLARLFGAFNSIGGVVK